MSKEVKKPVKKIYRVGWHTIQGVHSDNQKPPYTMPALKGREGKGYYVEGNPDGIARTYWEEYPTKKKAEEVLERERTDNPHMRFSMETVYRKKTNKKSKVKRCKCKK